MSKFGAWVWGFIGRCGAEVMTPLHAELIGIMVGMEAIQEKGLARVLIYRN